MTDAEIDPFDPNITDEQAKKLIRDGHAEDRRNAKALAKAKEDARLAELNRKAQILGQAKGNGPVVTALSSPKSLAARLRRATGDTKSTIDFFIELAEGRIPGADLKDRMVAHQWIADRSYGKAVSTELKIEVDGEQALESLSSEDLKNILALPDGGSDDDLI